MFIKRNSYLIMFGIVLILLSYTMSTVFADDYSYQKVLITVEEGDTLWNIASRYHHELGISIQDYVYEIRKLNELSSVMIYAGQNLEILKKEQQIF